MFLDEMMNSLNDEPQHAAGEVASMDELTFDPDKERRINAAYWQGVRVLSVDERCQIASQLTDIHRRVIKAGIKAKYPEYDESKVDLALARVLFGDHCFYQAFPNSDIQY